MSLSIIELRVKAELAYALFEPQLGPDLASILYQGINPRVDDEYKIILGEADETNGYNTIKLTDIYGDPFEFEMEGMIDSYSELFPAGSYHIQPYIHFIHIWDRIRANASFDWIITNGSMFDFSTLSDGLTRGHYRFRMKLTHVYDAEPAKRGVIIVGSEFTPISYSERTLPTLLK